MNHIMELFYDWHQMTYDQVPDYSKEETVMLLNAFSGGYTASHNHSQHSPVKIRQTPKSAADIGRQLREGLENDSLEKQEVEETIVGVRETETDQTMGKQAIACIKRELRRGGNQRQV